jgi:HSP20 family protein
MKDLIPRRKNGEKVMSAHKEDQSLGLLQRKMNDLFENFFEDFDMGFGQGPLMRRSDTWLAESPSFEVSETDDEFRVKAELPGMDEKDIEVNLEGNDLMIRGEKKREHDEKHRNYHLSEVSYGEFCRSIRLPEGIDRDKAKAQFKKGVLTLTLPKTEQGKAQRKRITVTAD